MGSVHTSLKAILHLEPQFRPAFQAIVSSTCISKTLQISLRISTWVCETIRQGLWGKVRSFATPMVHHKYDRPLLDQGLSVTETH